MECLEAEKPRVFLWSLPCAGSTRLTKCMGSLDCVQVWMEPYCVSASNLVLANPDIVQGSPGVFHFAKKFGEAKERVAQGTSQFVGGKLSSAQLLNYDWVQSELEKDAPGKPVQFIKDLAMGIDCHYDKLPRNVKCVHTFMIRHPYRQLPAVRNRIMGIFGHTGDPASFDVSVGNPFIKEEDQLHQLWKHVIETGGPAPIVIDSDELLQQPEVILPKYFEALGIPWDPKYLTWDPSVESVRQWRGAVEQIEWSNSNGVFTQSFASSCFTKPTDTAPPSEDNLTPDAKKYADVTLAGYQEMFSARLKPT